MADSGNTHARAMKKLRKANPTQAQRTNGKGSSGTSNPRKNAGTKAAARSAADNITKFLQASNSSPMRQAVQAKEFAKGATSGGTMGQASNINRSGSGTAKPSKANESASNSGTGSRALSRAASITVTKPSQRKSKKDPWASEW
jgi:hypothetical protein